MCCLHLDVQHASCKFSLCETIVYEEFCSARCMDATIQQMGGNFVCIPYTNEFLLFNFERYAMIIDQLSDDFDATQLFSLSIESCYRRWYKTEAINRFEFYWTKRFILHRSTPSLSSRSYCWSLSAANLLSFFSQRRLLFLMCNTCGLLSEWKESKQKWNEL